MWCDGGNVLGCFGKHDRVSRSNAAADAVDADRALLVGESVARRLVVTVFIEIGAEEARIVSARRATKRERRKYEEGQEE